MSSYDCKENGYDIDVNCQSFCTNCLFNILGEVRAKIEVLPLGPLTSHPFEITKCPYVEPIPAYHNQKLQ